VYTRASVHVYFYPQIMPPPANHAICSAWAAVQELVALCWLLVTADPQCRPDGDGMPELPPGMCSAGCKQMPHMLHVNVFSVRQAAMCGPGLPFMCIAG
jgi:hypothetical protein